MKWNSRLLLAATIAVSMTGVAQAEKKYGPGVTDTEIKIGNIMPYSGPASAYGTIGQTEAAYFRKINEEGGINGRKIIVVNTSASDFAPIQQEQLQKFTGDRWTLFGEIYDASKKATN